MKKFYSYSRVLPWLFAVMLAVFAAGCGGGGEGRDPILGSGVTGTGTIPGAPPGAIIPGAVCTAASGPTIPTVTMSDPTSGNQFATTSTLGVAGSGKNITATFSLAMNAATINSTTFTLAPVGGAVLTPASVTYNASTKVATLTTSSALLPNTSYTAIMTVGAVTSAGGVPLACSYAWNFKTVTPAAPGAAAVNLGLATPMAIAAEAGLNTAAAASTVNGDVVLEPTATCDAVNVDGAGGIGPCVAFQPTINGTVISHFFDPTTSRATIMADLKAAYLSIAPLNQAGTLTGATSLGCDVIGTGGGAGAGFGCAGNATLPAGVYIALNSSIGVTGVLTLDGGGDSNAKFVFQTKTPSTLTTAAGPGASEIRLINGAKASNVWWQVGSSATIGNNSIFNGNVLADTTITVGNLATSCGRMLAGAVTATGAITLNGAIVSVPGHASAPAGCQ